MSTAEKAVSPSDALVAATRDKDVRHIVVCGKLTDTPSINLLPGQTLRGDGAAVIFTAGSDGVQLSSDNRVHNIRLDTVPEKRAIFNDTSVDSLGRIELRSVTTIGRS